MLILPIITALAASNVSAYPEDFTAKCTGGQDISATFLDSDVAHPILRRQDQASYTVTILRRSGRFELELDGVDFTVLQADSREFKLHVLKAEPGDLALSVETATWGRSLSVYHLRYAGAVGALTVTTTNYSGHGSDNTTLMVMTCKIGTQSSP